MNMQGRRDLLLLQEFERDSAVSQRSLSTKLGVALGLTNLYIKRLARNGYITIATIAPNRIRYLLTPQGLAEKSRLSYLYMQYSLSHYRDMRAWLREALSAAIARGVKRVVIFGTSELAEMAYLSLREMNLILVGFVDEHRQDGFLSYPVWEPEALSGWEFDAVLLADLENAKRHIEILGRHQVPDEKVLAVRPSL